MAASRRNSRTPTTHIAKAFLLPYSMERQERGRSRSLFQQAFPVNANMTKWIRPWRALLRKQADAARDGLRRELEHLRRERNHHLRSLKDSERRFRVLFHASPDAIFLADLESGEILDINPSATILLGQQRERIIGSHYLQLHLFRTDDELSRLFSDYVRQITANEPEVIRGKRLVRPDGRILWVDISARLLNLNNRITILGILHPTTPAPRVI